MQATQFLRDLAPFFAAVAAGDKRHGLLCSRAQNEFFVDLHGHTEYTAQVRVQGLSAVTVCVYEHRLSLLVYLFLYLSIYASIYLSVFCSYLAVFCSYLAVFRSYLAVFDFFVYVLASLYMCE